MWLRLRPSCPAYWRIGAGAMPGAVLAGGILDGGMLEGGMLEGGMLEGGMLEGGTLEGGTLSAGTWITVSRSTPPPCTLPRTFEGAVIWVTQFWRCASGNRLQRARMFCWRCSGEAS